MRDLYPPVEITETCAMVGSLKNYTVITGYEPTRTSCYKEVEDFVNNPNTTSVELQGLMDGFPDITDVEFIHSGMTDNYVLLLKFCDDSVQRVELDKLKPLKIDAGSLSRFLPPPSYNALKGGY